MPSSSSVSEQLTDILVRVVGCPADAVVPHAVLKELGADSLTIVEIGEELGRRFDVYLSDDTIDSLVTVADAIEAIVGHDGSQPPAPPTNKVASVKKPTVALRRGRKTGFALRFALLGLILGAILGLGGAALVSATGIDDVDLPPITPPTAATPTKTPAPEPTPAPTASTGQPQPTIQASSTQVSPGERIVLSGAFPTSGKGDNLQVQVRDKGGPWDNFPVTTTTRDGGTFKTEVFTTRTGEREFRVWNTTIKKSSPAVSVEIG